MKRIAWFVVTIICMNAAVVCAQAPHFQKYFPVKRNQSLQVNALLQDRTGFIWLGTSRGLFRFDGSDYRHYDLTDSLPDSEITALAEDSLGRIWSGHQNGQLSYLENGSVQLFQPDEGTPIEAVSDILFDQQGRSEEHTSELQSLMRISYAVFCLKKKINNNYNQNNTTKHQSTQNVKLV